MCKENFGIISFETYRILTPVDMLYFQTTYAMTCKQQPLCFYYDYSVLS